MDSLCAQRITDVVRTMLDIHIANSFETATRNDPAFGIELEIHAAFFSERSAFATDYPLLLRMSDY